MNLKGRIENLENKFLPRKGVHVIELEEGETEEQAIQRYCAENGITVEDLDNRGPESLIIFLNTFKVKKQTLRKLRPSVELTTNF